MCRVPPDAPPLTNAELVQLHIRVIALENLVTSLLSEASDRQLMIAREMAAYITSMFMPRLRSDRPLPVPRETRNFAFVSQFVEIADDVVFTVEYSVRAAQMAVYELLGLERSIPPITPHDKSLRTQFEALIKAFK